jgi:hypothetical protein
MMEVMREQWTDARLDDLNRRVEAGFSEVSREFQAFRLEMRTELVAVRSEISSESQAVRSEIAANQRMLVQMMAGIWVTSLVGFTGIIATVVTQA